MGGGRRTYDLDSFFDILDSFDERRSCNDLSRFIFRQDLHDGELGVVPGYGIEPMRGIASRCILDCFNHIGIPMLASTSTEVSTTRVNTSTGGSTNIKDRARSNLPRELVIEGGTTVTTL